MLDNPYLWYKFLHLISLISWMAAMFYLPRLFVYHADSKPGSEQSETFKIMEKRLLRYIATPAMIATFIFGFLLLKENAAVMKDGWFHAKLTLVFILAGFHGLCAMWCKQFARDANNKSAKFYRIANEVPTVLLVLILFLVVLKPF